MSKRLDVLFVNPSGRSEIYQGLGNGVVAIEPPVWSGLMATYLKNKGYGVAILDAEALELTADAAAREILNASPRLIVYVIYGHQPSASTQSMASARKLCRKTNELWPESVSIAVGTHPSALPRRTLAEEPYRFVCEGEGPQTVAALLEALNATSPQLEKVPGLWWKDAYGEVFHNAPASKIADLDLEMPGQALDLLDMSLYRAHNWHCLSDLQSRQPYASLQTSLGCPFRCSFCCINAPFGGAGIRYWSPENIIGQIDTLVNKYGVKNIKIPDEMFVLNEKHVLGICDLIIERGYDLNIWAYARVDTVKDKFLEKLKKAGFNWLALGIESGSKHVRDGVQKGRFGEIDIEKVVDKIRASGINVLANYIFGLPDDDYDSMRATLKMAVDLNTEWANFYSAMAYPGSQLFNMAVENSWKLPSDWAGYSQHAYDTLPLPTLTLSGPEVLAFRDRAHIYYFSSPQFQDMLKNKFGQGALEHVRTLMLTPLRRQFVSEEMGIKAEHEVQLTVPPLASSRDSARIGHIEQASHALH